MNPALTDRFYSRQVLDNMLSSITEGVLILSAKTEIELVNGSALKVLGYNADEALLGKPVTAFLEDQLEVQYLLTALDNKERFENRESAFRTSKGTAVAVQYSAFRSTDELTGDTQYIIIFRPADGEEAESELADYTRRLEKSNRELDEFAYIVSHDLKAPLRAISNLSSWIQEDLGTELPGESAKNLSLLRSRVIRMEALINGILEYSKIGRQQLESESVNVFTLVQEAIELLAPPPHVEIVVDRNLPVLETARILLLQVFSNLIGNAIKHNNKERGLVKIYGIDQGKKFAFVVEDNGVGIEPAYHEKIFVIFQTLQSRDKTESTGIGLAIVKRILAAVGGSIRVESAVNEGSKFIFTWPAKVNAKSTC